MLCLSGWILDGGALREGYVLAENGIAAEAGGGRPPAEPDATGIIVPLMTDGHTHCADAGAARLVRPGMTLEELVAPPDGLKHRYLRSAPRDELLGSMRNFDSEAGANGIGRFIDFREGGLEGVLMAKSACPRAVVLGRPVSGEFDQAEIDSILRSADGIAIPSLTDIGNRYAERIADACRRAGKPFALHLSERIREDAEEALSLEPAFAVHMCEAAEGDLRMFADADVPIVSCPRSNRFFGKVPPLASMLSAGCTVALGTDNAMLCSPDLRPEASLAADILGSDGWDPSAVWGMMSSAGSKLLNRARALDGTIEGRRVCVLPCPGRDAGSALSCRSPAFTPR